MIEHEGVADIDNELGALELDSSTFCTYGPSTLLNKFLISSVVFAVQRALKSLDPSFSWGEI